jgi:peptide-methionine (S)-S-oxide reductase
VSGEEIAIFSGGCFWGVQAVFQHMIGVTSAVSGYTGGNVKNPGYEQVSTGTTGHAEATQITFDPEEVSFRDLLDVFFTIHDPTTLNRQGGDVGALPLGDLRTRPRRGRRIGDRGFTAAAVAEPDRHRVAPLTVFYPARPLALLRAPSASRTARGDRAEVAKFASTTSSACGVGGVRRGADRRRALSAGTAGPRP